MENTSNPRQHTAHVKAKMTELIDHLRQNVTRMDDPQAKALFETSAEVINGLIKAFSDYEQKNEAAWQP